jgi:hypothetical protein
MSLSCVPTIAAPFGLQCQVAHKATPAHAAGDEMSDKQREGVYIQVKHD